jgi:hypothetical protein
MLVLLLLLSAFASFKLAEEKGQNKILWTVATAFVGPIVLAVQYLTSWYRFKDVVK